MYEHKQMLIDWIPIPGRKIRYAVYDKVVQDFLTRFDEKKPIRSKWDSGAGDSGVEDAQIFSTKAGARYVVKRLERAFKNEPGGMVVDFAIIRVKPVTVYEYVDHSDFGD